jgi:hypothetical protein
MHQEPSDKVGYYSFLTFLPSPCSSIAQPYKEKAPKNPPELLEASLLV